MIWILAAIFIVLFVFWFINEDLGKQDEERFKEFEAYLWQKYLAELRKRFDEQK